MSGSRADIPDEELVQEWPFLTRQQLEEYKDAFKIFDRSGTGTFTKEDIGWVMRSLGQSPTEQQIAAIIRDMDLDNDGVIDLAEFMIRMMAFSTKTAPEEDLKHVFDVLDKSGTGMITADSLRSAIKNIAEWEMTDDEIEVAIKLADKSGDGQIDYDEFIAFVFGEAESVQRSHPTGAQPAPQLAGAGQIMAASAQTPASQQPTADALQMPTQQLQAPSNAPDVPASSWQEARQAASNQLATTQDAVQQSSMTDAWIASQTDGMLSAPEQQQAAPSQPQQGVVYDNALYQPEDMQPQSAQQLWQPSLQGAPADTGQPGDDVRLRIYSDDAESSQAMHPSSTSHEPEQSIHQAQQQAQQHSWQAPDGLQETHSLQQGALQDQHGHTEHGLGDEPPDLEALGISRTGQQHRTGRQPAPWDAPEVLQSVPPEAAPDLQQPVAAPQNDKSTVAGQTHPASKGKPTKPIIKTSPKPPRHLPPLSYDQLSQGINRSRVGHI